MYSKIKTSACLMMSSVIRNITRFKSKSLSSKHCYFLIFHFLVLFLICLSAQQLRKSTGAVYPTLTLTREHFLSAIRPYTALREVDRELAGSHYIEAPQLRKFQADVLRVLVDDYVDFHKRNRHNATRILIFRPRRTGLGDRLTVLAFAFWAASISKRLFLVDWQYPFPLTQLFQNARADVDVFFHAKVDDPENETVNGYLSSKVAHLNSTRIPGKECESTLFSNTRTVVLETSFSANLSSSVIEKIFPPGALPSYVNRVAATIPFYRVVYHHIFSLSDGMLQVHKQMSEKMRIRPTYPEHSANAIEEFDASARPYIAVHARVGAGVGEAQQGFRFFDISRNMKSGAMCLASRAVRLAHMVAHPPLPIYLATDTPSFRGIFREVVRNFSHGRVEVVGGDWDVLHMNAFRPFGSMQRSVQTRGKQKGLKDIFVDFVMLGHAEHMISLYSSFPRLALGVGTARTLTEMRNDVCFKVEKWE